MKSATVRVTGLWVGLAALAGALLMRWQPPIVEPAPVAAIEGGHLTLPEVQLPFGPAVPPSRLHRMMAPSRPLRAQVGETVSVSITAYCLRSLTRLDHVPREGIVAADPRVFSLGRDIDLILEGRPLGRFRVDDTGLLIKGRIVDLWLPDCDAARRFGRRRGHAILAANGSSALDK